MASTLPSTNGRSSVGSLRNSGRRPLKDQPNIGKYKLIRTLGRGNFAKVKLAEHVSTGQQVAVKVIDKTELNRTSLQKLSREVKIMKMLNHPNIVRLYEVIESDRHVYLVMEYAPNGEVFDYLVTNGRMKEKEARAKFRQLVSAVEYCHCKKIVHRDLKAENLLLDKDYNIKLADFGFSNFYDGENKLDTFCGSPPYAAPELFRGEKYFGPEVDVWSLGVILYTLVSGSLPFDAQHLKELQTRVIRGKYRVPFYMTTDCEALLRKLLVVNPSKRKPLKAVMSDKWLNVGYDDSVLEPYVEPPPDYNDPVRLAIMQKMGYSPADVREALENQSFNNVTAIYLLLADPQSHLNLPIQSIHPSRACKSDSYGDSPTPLSDVPTNYADKTPSRPTRVSIVTSNGCVDTDTPASSERKSAGVSWLKQSASAGPTPSSRNDRPSDVPPSQLLLRPQLLDTSKSVTNGADNASTNVEESNADGTWIRRNNTFTGKKVHPSNSDYSTPDQTCPLSRAPQFSDIPNHLASRVVTRETPDAESSNLDGPAAIVGHSDVEADLDGGTIRAMVPIQKLNVTTPFNRENPTFSCHRPRSRPPVPPDDAPTVRVDSNFKHEVVDMLDPVSRHQFARNCPERATVAITSRYFGGGGHRRPHRIQLEKPDIYALDSLSSSSNASRTGTLVGSSNNTLNYDAVRPCPSPVTQPGTTDTKTSTPLVVDPVYLPANASSAMTKDPRIQWSARHRVPEQISLAPENSEKPVVSKAQPTKTEYEAPQLRQAKEYRSGHFIRRLTLRISRGFRRPSNVSTSSDQYTTSPSSTVSESTPANPIGTAVQDVGANPDPWTTMQPNPRTCAVASASKHGTATSTIKDTQETDTVNGHQLEDDCDEVICENEPFIPGKDRDHANHLSGRKSRRLKDRMCPKSMESKSDASGGGRVSKPRRVHFVRRMRVTSQDPQLLLNETLRVLNANHISYQFQTTYNLLCSNAPLHTLASNEGKEQDKLLRSDPNCAALNWKTEVIQSSGKRYGVRCKRLSGDSTIFKKMKRRLLSQYNVK